MKILLVWPNRGEYGLKPLGLSLISAILKRQGHEVDLFDTTFFNLGLESSDECKNQIKIFKDVDFGKYDMSKKNVNFKKEFFHKIDMFQPDIVGISALFDEKEIAFEISRFTKEWNSKTIVLWGNKHATMSYDEVLKNENVDYACLGEGIEFIGDFIDYLHGNRDISQVNNLAYKNEKSEIIQNSLNPYFQDIDSLPPLDWSIFDERQFIRAYDGSIYRGGDHMISWGCPNACTYCINKSYREFYKEKCGFDTGAYVRKYSIDRIINELEDKKNKWDLTFLKFHDEDFCLKSLSYMEEFKNKYIERVNIPFTCMVNAKTATLEKLKIMKDMNCVSISTGIENGNNFIRTNILKRKESKDDIIKAIGYMNDLGIRTSSFNMLGVPFDTKETVMETISLNRKSKVQSPNCCFFYPLEKTELRDIAVKNGFFHPDTDDISDTNSPCLKLPGISKKELIKIRERFVLYIKMPKEFYRFIDRSKEDDNVGLELLNNLYDIYDICVLANDGYWDAKDKENIYIDKLTKIIATENC